jgi:hypothetical protein
MAGNASEGGWIQREGKQEGDETTQLGSNDRGKDPNEWALEVYQDRRSAPEAAVEEDDVLEIHLYEEEVEQAAKFLAIAVYYSRKSSTLKFFLLPCSWHGGSMIVCP